MLEVTNVGSSTAAASTPAPVEAKLSDGKHYSCIVLSKKLHSLINSKQLHRGVLVQMTNYISHPVDGAKNVISCLDVTVVSPSDTIIYGNPSEDFPSALPFVVTPEFVGSVSDGFYTHCEQEPCNWSSLGHNIVETVRAENTSTTVDGAMANKSYQFAAYQMYARVKYGYLGKGNRKPLPLCVTNGIRENFPDPKSVYVGFQLVNDEE